MGPVFCAPPFRVERKNGLDGCIWFVRVSLGSFALSQSQNDALGRAEENRCTNHHESVSKIYLRQVPTPGVSGQRQPSFDFLQAWHARERPLDSSE